MLVLIFNIVNYAKEKMSRLLILFLLTSCNTLPQLYQAAESIANDEAIEIMISREAMKKKSDINIVINVRGNQKTMQEI